MVCRTPDLERGDPWTAKDGLPVVIRSIRGPNETKLARFHQTLSPESVYTRYFNFIKLSQRIAHERLFRVCHPIAGEEVVSGRRSRKRLTR